MARPRKQWHITGEVAPPGTLAPNLHHPYARLTADERWQMVISECADILLKACEARENDGVDRTGESQR
jgi:hypothetical protein